MFEIIVHISRNFLSSISTIAQVLATFYIGIAIFVAESVRNISEKYGVNLSGSLFAKVLKFWQSVVLVIVLAALPEIISSDLSSTDFKGIKYPLIAFIVFIILATIIVTMYKILDSADPTKIRQLFFEHSDREKISEYLITQWSKSKPSPKNAVEYAAHQELEDELLSQLEKLLNTSIEKQTQPEVLARTLSEFIGWFDKRPTDNWNYNERVFDAVSSAWQKLEENYQDATRAGFYGIQRSFVKIIEKLLLYGIENRDYVDLVFEKLHKFLSSLDKKSQTKFLQQLDIETLFFEKIPEQQSSFEIWEYSIPSDWKATYDNLITNPNPVAIILFNRFMRWAQGRFFKDKDVDEKLDDVATHLFPGLDPIMWARLLEYRYAPWVDDKHLKYIVSQTSTFAFAKHYPMQNYVDDKTTIENMKIEDEKMVAATSKLVLALRLFDEKSLEEALLEVKELKKDKTLGEREKRKLQQHETFFKRLKSDLSSQTKKLPKKK
jgi:hypothetical protein